MSTNAPLTPKQIKAIQKKGKESWNIRPYLSMGLTAFIVLALTVCLYFFIERYNGASALVTKIISTLQPILFGIFFGYLLNPLVNKIQNLINRSTKEDKPFGAFCHKVSRAMGVIISMLLLLAALLVLINLIVPQLIATVEGLVVSLPAQVQELSNDAEELVDNNKFLSQYADQLIQEGTVYLENWLKTSLLPQSKELLSEVTIGIFAFAKGIINFLIGLIVCIYVLMEKDHFIGISKKMVYGFFSAKTSNEILKIGRKSHEIFSGFIVGKIVDSAIIGVLTYFVLSIFGIPYAVLVSVIVGVTNVIPFFGPYIGAVPSFLLILLADPLKSLYFLIIILVIQQIDGNIIGPKILGNSTGLSSFWVVFAILFGGGMFGFMGMIFGVPVFAVVYYCINEITKHSLQKKNMPLKSEAYTNVESMDENDLSLKYFQEKPKEKEEVKPGNPHKNPYKFF